MTARAFRLRAACCFCPSSCPARSFVLCYFESPQQKSMFPSGMLPQVRTCRWTVAAWHKLLGALTLCVYGQTFDLWCSILARSRGTVLLIFGIDPASGPASQIQKVRARAKHRIAFALRQACFARTGSRCAGAFSWPLRLLERGPFGQLVSCRGPASSLYLGTNSVRLQCCRRRRAGRRIPRQSDRQRALPRCAERFLDCARARSAAANLSERCGRCSRFCFRSARGASVDPAIAIAILEDGKQRGRNARPRDGRRSGEREGFRGQRKLLCDPGAVSS